MHTRQTIVVIGSSSESHTLVAMLARGNNNVLVCDKDQQQATENNRGFVGENVEMVDCAFSSAWEADVILLAANPESLAESAEKIKQVVCQKIIVHVSASEINNDQPVTNELQALLPFSKVVRLHLLSSSTHSVPHISLSGNDNEAVQSVAELFNEVGVHISKQPVVHTS